jgi:single-stranded-DNA-specific exonuclease
MKSLAEVLLGLAPTGEAAPAAAPVPVVPVAAPGARRIERREPAAGAALDGLPPLLQRLYAARGVMQGSELTLGLEGLLPVGSLDHVDEAAALLVRHHAAGTRVLVVGDFDADGATSSAVMVRCLRKFGFAHVDFLVPDRFRFGYGLTPEIVEVAASRTPGLLITVDNGVSSLEGVAKARALGMDVLVTDHHLPGPVLPDATVMVNPNLHDAQFGSRALAGVGVAFYVMAATARLLGQPSSIVAEVLDLVALGTVADVVPLDRNNRILVQQGLRRIRAGRCTPGVRALLEIAGRPLDRVTASDLGFQAGPRLNAAGRMDDMTIGIECLLAEDEAAARALAQRLDTLNRERREVEAGMQEQAMEIVRELRDAGVRGLPAGLCLHDPEWHPGVVGLVASRVKDRVHRPVIAFARDADGRLRGSGRSVSGVHLRDALEAVSTRHPGLIERFGGHAMAAGLTLHAGQEAAFAAAFARVVAEHLPPAHLRGVLVTDGALDVREISLETAQLLREGGPWGSAFPEPTFDGEFEVVETQVLAKRHLKLHLRGSPKAKPVEAVAFGYLAEGGRAVPADGARLRVVYRLDVNHYAGRDRHQLLVEHLEPAPLPAGTA